MLWAEAPEAQARAITAKAAAIARIFICCSLSGGRFAAAAHGLFVRRRCRRARLPGAATERTPGSRWRVGRSVGMPPCRMRGDADGSQRSVSLYCLAFCPKPAHHGCPYKPRQWKVLCLPGQWKISSGAAQRKFMGGTTQEQAAQRRQVTKEDWGRIPKLGFCQIRIPPKWPPRNFPWFLVGSHRCKRLSL